MPRDGQTTRKRILTAANRLFYRDGIGSVSMDAVASKSGITKKSLYYHFRSKDDLVTEYLQSRDLPNLRQYEAWFDQATGKPEDRVFAIFQGIADASSSKSWRGCGYMRTVGELANKPGHPAIQAAAAHKKGVERCLEDRLRSSGIQHPADLARKLTILLDGAFASALIFRDPDYVLQAGHAAKQLTQAASGDLV